MKINQTTFYAMRILYRIHIEDDRVVTSKMIAEKEEISPGVTLRILREMSKADLVCVHQGRGQICGGFSLAKSIDDITMADVIETLEGIDINFSRERGIWDRDEPLYQICGHINDRLKELFSGYTIRRLFETKEEDDT